MSDKKTQKKTEKKEPKSETTPDRKTAETVHLSAEELRKISGGAGATSGQPITK
jgi:hypothetical protein